MDFAGMRPRFMMLGPGNEILISDTSGNGSVFVIKDGARTPIIEKLDRPYGLALKGDQLYVAEPTSVKVYTYDAKTMRVTSPGKEIISLAGMGTGHNTRTLAFNRDGSKLYLSVGSQSNIDLGEPTDARRRASLQSRRHRTRNRRDRPAQRRRHALLSGHRRSVGVRARARRARRRPRARLRHEGRDRAASTAGRSPTSVRTPSRATRTSTWRR